MNIEIKLQFNSEDFKEIYFINNRGNYLLSPTVKLWVIVFSALLILELISILFFPEKIFIISVLALGLTVSFSMYVYAAFLLWKWKKSLFVYLNEMGRISNHKIILTDNAFSLVQDDRESIEKWETIKSADITSSYISISGKDNYLFPKKSLGSDSYEQLKIIVSEKLK